MGAYRLLPTGAKRAMRRTQNCGRGGRENEKYMERGSTELPVMAVAVTVAMVVVVQWL